MRACMFDLCFYKFFDACLVLLQVSRVIIPYLFVLKSFFVLLAKTSEMGANPYRIDQNELELGQVMRVRREESVFPSLYPCNQFMRDAGILEDFNSLLSNAGLEHFVGDEPYVKLTMSVVQDFICSFDSLNPMV